MNALLLALKGMAMGIAEVIPGVSGGTIAFITGIYERLINAIKSILGPSVIEGLKEGGIAGAWKKIDGNFLVFLLGGMVVGILVGVFGVSYLLENYPELVWAFFFGLIIASAIYIARQVSQWGMSQVIALIIGIAVSYFITVAAPAAGTESKLFVFLAGAVAISALILPGISGSFILLLLGMYQFILHDTLKTGVLENQDGDAIITMAIFGLGCLVGLATFSRVLSWTFKYYANTTLALLTGFMIGSLNKVWPWRNVIQTRINSEGKEVPFLEESVLPGAYEGDPQIFMVLIAMLVGFALVFGLERLGEKGAQ